MDKPSTYIAHHQEIPSVIITINIALVNLTQSYTHCQEPLDKARRNTIIEWVNELRLKTTTKMDSTTEHQTPVAPGQHNDEKSSFLYCQQLHGNFRDFDNDELQVLISLAINTL